MTDHNTTPDERVMRARFTGCLVGGAVGDALGAPVEFMSTQLIQQRFGPAGITEYAPAYGGLGRITDDTQMTLFTAEGLLRTWVRSCVRGGASCAGVTANAYLRWLQTQGERSRCRIETGEGQTGWLMQQPELHSRRAPGNTCLDALRTMQSMGEPAHNDSKGCGGVMRVAPVGLMGWRLRRQWSLPQTFELGTELAALTHGHPTGSLTAGVLAALIALLVEGVTLRAALQQAKALLQRHPQHEETLRALDKAEALAGSDVPRSKALQQLGQGWVAEEALAMAVYCALVEPDFREAVILAVNHDGDSDSTGSITGNLVGAMQGVQVIPESWLQPLELREVIITLAQDLYDCTSWQLGDMSETGETDPRVWEKYPGF